MQSLIIHTDGTYFPGYKVGSWAGIIQGVDSKGRPRQVELVGSLNEPVGNYQMEILAVINCLSAVVEPSIIEVYSDVQGLVNLLNSFNSWMCLPQGPKSLQGHLGSSEIEKLKKVLTYHTVRFVWIKGHKGNVKNQRCDRLARKSAIALALRLGTFKPKVQEPKKVTCPINPQVNCHSTNRLEVWQL